jgi:hypothetical protein
VEGVDAPTPGLPVTPAVAAPDPSAYMTAFGHRMTAISSASATGAMTETARPAEAEIDWSIRIHDRSSRRHCRQDRGFHPRGGDPYEKDPRTGPHGPSDELVQELPREARKAGVLTPHILPDGSHLTQAETAKALIKSGLSPLGPLACNTDGAR